MRAYVTSTAPGEWIGDEDQLAEDLPHWLKVCEPTEEMILDLSWHPLIARPDGFWPADVEEIEYDPATRAPDGYALEPRPSERRVTATLRTRPLTEEELPEVEAAPDLSLKQFALVMAEDEVLTDEEALDWAASRVLPATLVALVAQIRNFDPTLALRVEMDLRASTLLQRYHGNTLMIASLLSSPERVFDAPYLDSVWLRGRFL